MDHPDIMSRKAEIGVALDELANEVVIQVLSLVTQYRNPEFSHLSEDMIKQAVDTPQRAKAQITEWIDLYDARPGNSPGDGQTFLNECLTAAGSAKTVGSINTEITTLETQAQTLVDNVNNSAWTWDQVADAIEAQFAREAEEEFSFRQLPIPSGYTTVWGDPW